MIEIYTDGSCSTNGTWCGGWGVVIGELEFGGYAPNTTNNRMEMTAMLKALEWCEENEQKAIIYTDSTYVQKALTQWCKKWCKDDFKRDIKNKDLWKVLYPLYLRSDCEVRWCKGHSGNEGNDKADKLAVHCMKNKEGYYGKSMGCARS